MDENTKRAWLKRVLFLKVMMTLFAWGLPVLLADAAFLDFFNLSMPEDPIYLRFWSSLYGIWGGRPVCIPGPAAKPGNYPGWNRG